MTTGAENKQEATEQNSSCRNGWTDDEKRRLCSVTFPLIEMQKQYGREIDAKLVMRGWEVKLAGRFSIDQILFALDRYTDKRDDFPTPANLINILQPEEPEITEAQFIEAQKWQERNRDYSKYSAASETIHLYKRQKEEKSREAHVTCQKVHQLAASCVKKISQSKTLDEESPFVPTEYKMPERISHKTEEWKTKEQRDWSHADWMEYVSDARGMLSLAKKSPHLLNVEMWQKAIEEREKEFAERG